jgi:hypothetical protein
MSTTRNLLVTVPFICSRTEKEHNVKVPLAEAEAFMGGMAAKEAAAEAVKTGIEGMAVRPDVVLYYKGQTIVLANVHDKSDAAISRAFNEIANKDVFALPEPKPRKKAENTETPAAAAGEPEAE